MRPILVGMCPGPRHDPDRPLYPLPRNSAGHRLQVLSGLSATGYLRAYARINVFYEHQPRWLAASARREVARL